MFVLAFVSVAPAFRSGSFFGLFVATVAVILSMGQISAQDVAQEAPAVAALGSGVPADFASVEIARSRACVKVIADVEELNLRLQPIGERAERLGALLQAVVLEDRNIMEELDQDDALEAAVHAWFVADGRLARSFVDTGNEDLQRQRTVGREGIKARVQGAMEEAQEEARVLVEETGDLGQMAASCDGAIFVRQAVLEACEDQESPVCSKAGEEVADSALPYRFVDEAENIWYVEEIRPWTAPQGLQIAPDGSVGGATTFALARRGNVALSVGFSPLIRERAQLDDSLEVQLDNILDSLAIDFDHPDVVFAPSISIRATLPAALGGAQRYILHFVPPDNADIVWLGPAGSGRILEDVVVLDPRHVQALVGGQDLALSAIAGEISPPGDEEQASAELVFTLPLTTANQTPATGALLGYMAQQMPAELVQLFSNFMG